MRKTNILLLFLMLLTSCAANEAPDATAGASPAIDVSAINVDETDPDFIFLKNADFFAYGAVGEAGQIPEEIIAFGRLFQKENALDYFYKLEAEANNEGKLYALCGLYYMDYDRYCTLMETYSMADESATCMYGCISSEYPMREIIKSDDIEDFYGGSIPDIVMQIVKETPSNITK